MLEYYPLIRTAHIFAALLSGSLFFVRGVGLLRGKSWPKARAVCYFTYFNDTVLLVAAFLLVGILRVYPFVQGWLTVKVVCLVVYIVLGVMAFREEHSRSRQTVLWLCALMVYGFIIFVARTHHQWVF